MRLRPWLVTLNASPRNETQNMNETISPAVTPVQDTEKIAVHKVASNTAMTFAGCAVAVFVFGVLFGAAWPGAVAACGISAAAVGVSWIVLRGS